MKRDSIVVIRAIIAVELGVIPELPWPDYQIEDAGWVTFWPQGRVRSPGHFVHARIATLNPQPGTRAAVLLMGPSVSLDAIAAAVPRDAWAGLVALRADVSAEAIEAKRDWAAGTGVKLDARMAGYADTDAEDRKTEEAPADTSIPARVEKM